MTTPTERLAALADAQAHAELYELLVDAGGANPHRDYEAGLPMADHECKHGRLPHEGCEACAEEAAA